jgi:hypothetical protein
MLILLGKQYINNEDNYDLVCDAALPGRSLLKFRRSVPPPSSESKMGKLLADYTAPNPIAFSVNNPNTTKKNQIPDHPSSDGARRSVVG